MGGRNKYIGSLERLHKENTQQRTRICISVDASDPFVYPPFTFMYAFSAKIQFDLAIKIGTCLDLPNKETQTSDLTEKKIIKEKKNQTTSTKSECTVTAHMLIVYLSTFSFLFIWYTPVIGHRAQGGIVCTHRQKVI